MALIGLLVVSRRCGLMLWDLLFYFLLFGGRWRVRVDDSWILALELLIPPPSTLLIDSAAGFGHGSRRLLHRERERLGVHVAGCWSLRVLQIELSRSFLAKSFWIMRPRRKMSHISRLRLINIEMTEVFLHESFFEIAMMATIICRVHFSKLLLVLRLILNIPESEIVLVLNLVREVYWRERRIERLHLRWNKRVVYTWTILFEAPCLKSTILLIPWI